MHGIKRLMKLHRLLDVAGEGGSNTGGTGTGAGGEGESAEAKAAKEAADAAAAAKAAEGSAAKPSDAEAKLLKDAMKHKTRANELESQLSQVNEKLKSFEGIDLEKVRAMLGEQEEAERKKLESKGEYDRLVKQMGERHTTEKTQLQQQIEDAQRAGSSLQQQIADLTVGGSFGSSAFVRDDLTLTPAKARVIYGAHFEFKDGKVIGFDKPSGASDRTMLVSSAGDALGFDEALQKIVDADPDRDHLIRSKMKPGAGSGTNTKGVKKEVNTRELTSIERIASGLKTLANKK